MVSTLHGHLSITQLRKQGRTSTRLITTRLTMTINIRGTILTRHNSRLKDISTLIGISNSRNIKAYIFIKGRQLHMVKPLHPLMRRQHKAYTAHHNPNRTTVIIGPTRLILRRSRHNRNKHIRHLILAKILSNKNRKRRQEGPTSHTQRTSTFDSTMNTISHDQKGRNSPRTTIKTRHLLQKRMMNINLTSVRIRHTNTTHNVSRDRHTLLLKAFSALSQNHRTDKHFIIHPTMDIRVFNRLQRTVHTQFTHRSLQVLGRQHKLHKLNRFHTRKTMHTRHHLTNSGQHTNSIPRHTNTTITRRSLVTIKGLRRVQRTFTSKTSRLLSQNLTIQNTRGVTHTHIRHLSLLQASFTQPQTRASVLQGRINEGIRDIHRIVRK